MLQARDDAIKDTDEADLQELDAAFAPFSEDEMTQGKPLGIHPRWSDSSVTDAVSICKVGAGFDREPRARRRHPRSHHQRP